VEIIDYSWDAIENEMNRLKKVFLNTRLVNPLCRSEISNFSGNKAVYVPKCYSLLKRKEECSNCVSERAFFTKSKEMKCEFVDGNLFLIIAQMVTVEGKEYVLEMVSKVDDIKHIIELVGFDSHEVVDYFNDMNNSLNIDELTQSYNRRYLNKNLPFLLEKAKYFHVDIAVVVIDIDDFKVINDTYGHNVGDAVLIKVVDLLNQLAHSENSFAIRYGGDEFIVVEYSTSKEILQEKLERLIKDVGFINPTSDETFQVTVSIGAAFTSEFENMEMDQLIAIADCRLNESKQNGKNRIKIDGD